LEPDVAIAERLAKVSPARRMTFAEWLISLGPDDRKALENACHPDSGYTNVQLLEIIVEEGGPASKDALAGYRKTLA
jgi:hypothetical protein